jgi:hypothetical protein
LQEGTASIFRVKEQDKQTIRKKQLAGALLGFLLLVWLTLQPSEMLVNFYQII